MLLILTNLWLRKKLNLLLADFHGAETEKFSEKHYLN
jgi:hypothetical protein